MASTSEQKADTAQTRSRRAHYRIIYPLRKRPSLLCGEVTYAVVNLSESGVQVTCPPEQSLVVDAPVAGLIRFADGSETPVKGAVLRRDRNRAVIRFSQRVPLRVIMEQQRQLIQESLA